MKSKSQDRMAGKLFLRGAGSSRLIRGGSAYTFTEYSDEKIEALQRTINNARSSSMLFDKRVEDLCFSLNQVQVVESVAHKQFEAALAKMRQERGLTQIHEPVKTQTSNSSDDTHSEPSLNFFEEHEGSLTHRQHLEYLGRTLATQLPTYPARQTPPRDFVNHISGAIEKELFVPTYIKSPIKSDTSDGASDSTKSFTTSSKSSHNSASSSPAKNSHSSTHSNTYTTSRSDSLIFANSSEESDFSILKNVEETGKETVQESITRNPRTRPEKVVKTPPRRSRRLKERAAANNSLLE